MIKLILPDDSERDIDCKYCTPSFAVGDVVVVEIEPRKWSSFEVGSVERILECSSQADDSPLRQTLMRVYLRK